jgi:hypothetical protein
MRQKHEEKKTMKSNEIKSTSKTTGRIRSAQTIGEQAEAAEARKNGFRNNTTSMNYSKSIANNTHSKYAGGASLGLCRT